MTENPQDTRAVPPSPEGRGAHPGVVLEPPRGARARWWLVAAVGVVALVAGAGGGWAAARHATGGIEATVTPGDQRAPVERPASMLALGSEHVSFRGRGLSGSAGSATVRGLDPAPALTVEAVTRAARALGLSGTPVARWGSWVIGSTDGTGPSLSISGDGTASASYGDPTLTCDSAPPGELAPAPPVPKVPGPAPTARVPVPVVPTAPVGPPATIEPGPALAPGSALAPRPADATATAPGCSGTALGVAAATDHARALLAAMGADLGEPATSVSQHGAMSTVDLRQVLDGQETGLAWSVSFVGPAVQSLGGPLAHLVDLGAYPVVSAADAVARLSDPRFATGAALPMETPAEGAVPSGSTRGSPDARPTAGSGSTAATSDASGPGSTGPGSTGSGSTGSGSSGSAGVDPGQDATPVPVPSPGARLAWAVRQVTLVRADLVVVPTALSDGSTVLLPTYRFTDADGGIWQAPAVAEAMLDLAAG